MKLFSNIIVAIIAVVSLCSCSASRATSADKVAAESLAVGEGRADSVVHKSLASIFADKTIELTDLSIIFQPSPDTLNSLPPQSEGPESFAVARPRIRAKPVQSQTQPLQITVGKLTVSEKSGATVAQSTDSVASTATDLQADKSNHEVTEATHDNTSVSTSCRLILLIFIIAGIVTGYIIYRRRKQGQSS